LTGILCLARRDCQMRRVRREGSEFRPEWLEVIDERLVDEDIPIRQDIQMPPQRKRKEDIRLSIEYFVKKFAEKIAKRIRNIKKRKKRTLELCRHTLGPAIFASCRILSRDS
jgi:hypothetical protein